MPLDTTVRHYTSNMNGAPSLSSTANTLIQVLDAVLVNGFGNATLTSLVVSNNIATATVSTGFNVAPYCVVTISGATPSGLNGDKKVLSNTSNNIIFTFDATGIADQTATGTITVKFPGAGWTKPFANTVGNIAVYRNSTVNGTGFYLQVSDSTNPARIVAYESMTDADTGVNASPNSSQFGGGLYVPKGSNTSAKIWWIIADSKTFYYAVAANAGAPNNVIPLLYAGDVKSLGANDNYQFMLSTSSRGDLGPNHARWSIFSNETAYHRRYLSRAYSQVVGPKEGYLKFLYNNSLTYQASGASNGFTYGNYPENAITIFDKCWIQESNAIRGYLYGCTVTPQSIGPAERALENDTAFTNLPTPGKISLLKMIGNVENSSTELGAFFIDVSGPWE